jgi:hypothetical protein
MNNRLIVPIGILIAAALIMVAGYIILVDEKQVDKKPVESAKNNDTESYIENATDNNREISKDSDTRTHLTNLTKNTKPAFEIGDNYVYEVPIGGLENGMSGDVAYFNVSKCIREYTIIDNMRINKTQYFKIQEGIHKCVVGVVKFKGVLKPVFTGGVNRTIYLNADTGELFTDVETGENKRINGCYWSKCWYEDWMLALADDVEWKKTVVDRGVEEIHDFSVEGREKIGGRECFKVKDEVKKCSNGNCKIEHKLLYWIDADKRILLKYEHWYGNLLTAETRLIDQNYFKK